MQISTSKEDVAILRGRATLMVRKFKLLSKYNACYQLEGTMLGDSSVYGYEIAAEAVKPTVAFDLLEVGYTTDLVDVYSKRKNPFLTELERSVLTTSIVKREDYRPGKNELSDEILDKLARLNEIDRKKIAKIITS